MKMWMVDEAGCTGACLEFFCLVSPLFWAQKRIYLGHLGVVLMEIMGEASASPNTPGADTGAYHFLQREHATLCSFPAAGSVKIEELLPMCPGLTGL